MRKVKPTQIHIYAVYEVSCRELLVEQCFTVKETNSGCSIKMKTPLEKHFKTVEIANLKIYSSLIFSGFNAQAKTEDLYFSMLFAT